MKMMSLEKVDYLQPFLPQPYEDIITKTMSRLKK